MDARGLFNEGALEPLPWDLFGPAEAMMIEDEEPEQQQQQPPPPPPPPPPPAGEAAEADDSDPSSPETFNEYDYSSAPTTSEEESEPARARYESSCSTLNEYSTDEDLPPLIVERAQPEPPRPPQPNDNPGRQDGLFNQGALEPLPWDLFGPAEAMMDEGLEAGPQDAAPGDPPSSPSSSSSSSMPSSPSSSSSDASVRGVDILRFHQLERSRKALFRKKKRFVPYQWGQRSPKPHSPDWPLLDADFPPYLIEADQRPAQQPEVDYLQLFVDPIINEEVETGRAPAAAAGARAAGPCDGHRRCGDLSCVACERVRVELGIPPSPSRANDGVAPRQYRYEVRTYGKRKRVTETDEVFDRVAKNWRGEHVMCVPSVRPEPVASLNVDLVADAPADHPPAQVLEEALQPAQVVVEQVQPPPPAPSAAPVEDLPRRSTRVRRPVDRYQSIDFRTPSQLRRRRPRRAAGRRPGGAPVRP